MVVSVRSLESVSDAPQNVGFRGAMCTFGALLGRLLLWSSLVLLFFRHLLLCMGGALACSILEFESVS